MLSAKSFERGLMVSDTVLVPPLQFVSAEAGTDAVESQCVRQLTQEMTRLQKVDYYRATIVFK